MPGCQDKKEVSLRLATLRSTMMHSPLSPGHRDPRLENVPAFLIFNLTIVGPSVLTSISSVTIGQVSFFFFSASLQSPEIRCCQDIGTAVLYVVMYSLNRPRYTINFEDCGTSRSLCGPERAVPAVTNEAVSDCPGLRGSISCHI
jgi:hypothetical protein